MSVSDWIRNLRESIKQKKSAKLQMQAHATGAGSFSQAQVWTGAVSMDRLPPPTPPPPSESGPGGYFSASTVHGSAVPAPRVPAAPAPTAAATPAPAPAAPAPPVDRSSAQFFSADSFPSAASDTSIRYLADVPGEMRERIQQEGMARVFRRLETPLRALNMATSRKGANYPAEEMRGFLIMWRQALADYVGLVPDERSVLVYERSVDESYFVRGRCTIGAHLTVIEPCWRLNGEVVVRGEAQVVQGWVR